MNKSDIETLIICSTRYALGRSTYITWDIGRIIAAHLPEMTINCVVVLYRDIKAEIDRGNYGMQCDLDQWIKMLLILEQRRDAIQST